jgi:hypothetical protein
MCGGRADVYGVAALAHTVCADASEHCPQWAAQGECATNPGYMVRVPTRQVSRAMHVPEHMGWVWVR